MKIQKSNIRNQNCDFACGDAYFLKKNSNTRCEKENKVVTLRKKSKNEKAFTIVELLTVMSVIIILIGLLVPSLNKVRQYAREVKQNAQFHSINIALEMFDKENEGFPDSNPTDTDNVEYCGAMKLAEALVGQDLLGFHRDSMFMADMEDAFDNILYDIPGGTAPQPEALKARIGPYLQLDNANATRLTPYVDTGNQIDDPGIWDSSKINPFPASLQYVFVLCDVFSRRMLTGYKAGMPILYYRVKEYGNVNPNSINGYSKTEPLRFYEHEDNEDLVSLDNPWSGDTDSHPLDNDYTQNSAAGRPWPELPDSFYYQINNDSISVRDGRPYRMDSYILLSAGHDGLYGTRDDIYNFQKK